MRPRHDQFWGDNLSDFLRFVANLGFHELDIFPASILAFILASIPYPSLHRAFDSRAGESWQPRGNVPDGHAWQVEYGIGFVFVIARDFEGST
jgi:hypothetical protein